MPKYDLSDFTISFSSGKFNQANLEELLTRMFIASDEEECKHQSLTGIARPPQDIPASLFDKVWAKNEPHVTIQGRPLTKRSDWKKLRGLTKDVLVGNNVKPESLHLVTYSYKKDPNTDEAEKVWKEFIKQMQDFLDYIVKAISNDKKAKINIKMLSYAEHAHLNSVNRLDFLILFQITNSMNRDGKEIICSNPELLPELFSMFHEYVESKEG